MSNAQAMTHVTIERGAQGDMNRGRLNAERSALNAERSALNAERSHRPSRTGHPRVKPDATPSLQ